MGDSSVGDEDTTDRCDESVDCGEGVEKNPQGENGGDDEDEEFDEESDDEPRYRAEWMNDEGRRRKKRHVWSELV